MFDRRLRVIILAGLWVGLLTGCPDKKAKYPACDGDKDCKDGQVCVNKKCVECAKDSDCPEGKSCVNNGCFETEGACTSDEQCDEGQVCKDGRCSACEVNTECGPGGKCEAGVCQRPKACKVDDDCADDEDCIEGRCRQPWNEGSGDQTSCTLETIYFGFDQAIISDVAREGLNKGAECLREQGGRGAYVYGHADDSGTEEYNIALSERRARAVADYLARLGIDPARLYVIPKGESQLTGRGPEADRRVEFEWQ